MKLINTPIVVTGVAASPPIPTDARMNPVTVWGSIIDAGVSTYAVQYTTSDVYAPGYNPATDAMWTPVPAGPTTGSKPFNVTGLGASAVRVNVTVGPATVTINTVFQSDNTLGA